MAAIPLTEEAVYSVKQTLRHRFPKDKSSHLSEALAAALSFKTSMSLVETIRQTDRQDPDYVMADERQFLSRLAQLSDRKFTSADRSLNFDNLRYPEPVPIVRTRSKGWERVKYGKSIRRRAWRNMMIAAINEGIRLRAFTIRAGDNRWPGADRDERGHLVCFVYPFSIGGLSGIASVNDAGYDELSLHAALWPTEDAARWIQSSNACFLAGEVFASGWLERRDGAWLQVGRELSAHQFACRKHRLAEVAAITIEPNGYADRGSFKL